MTILPYSGMEELVRWQLEPTGFTPEDFASRGFVAYGKDQIFWDRKEGIQLKTPSGKIEFKSSLLENAGFASFPDYEPVLANADNTFRLVVGRTALHTRVSTQNNLYLNELFPENLLWINSGKAATLGIRSGDTVEVTSACGSGSIKAFATELIHLEAVFMIHGFSHEAKLATRCYNKGL
jgi:thiosulfate reductase/polysulfide reductase chain A